MKKALILFILALTLSCTQKSPTPPDQRIKEAIIETCAEFDISEYSYIITDSKEILEKKWNSSDEFTDGKKIISNFSTYLSLKQLIDDEIVDEDSTLSTYTSFVKDSLKIKDIYQVLENQKDFKPSDLEDHKSYIQYIYQKETGSTLSDFEEKELDIKAQEKWNSHSLLNAMARISLYSDQKSITGYLPMGDHIPDLNPIWYTRNKRYYAGWHIFKINRHAIFWNYFSDNKQTLLCMKCIDNGLFASIVLPKGSMPAPSDFNHEDLLQSPMATAILKAMFMPENMPKVNFQETTSKIEKKLKELKNSPYISLFIKDLASRIAFYSNNGKHTQAKRLSKIYEETYPYALPITFFNKPCISEINYVGDSVSAFRTFTLDQPTRLTVVSSGQCMLDMAASGIDKSDKVELYISYLNKQKKVQYFNLKFKYGCEKASGNYLQNNPPNFTIKDLNDTTYLLKAAIPWKTLNIEKPHLNSKFKLNLLVYDNDLRNQWKKSILSWVVDSVKNFEKPEKYGNLILATGKKDGNDTTIFCQRNPGIKELWNNIDFVPILKIAEGKISSSFDNAARFKIAWDNDTLYLVAEVTDNIKNKPITINMDKCWIMNMKTGEPVWKQPGEANSPFFPVCVFKNHEIMLKAGTYQLRYLSDNKHSFEYWLGTTPPIGDYGVRLYKK
ncbi:MAG: sugar-binding protein [Bacteroidales bacterium]|nr:sugar-binding protein [Bacteroidales bacterium]